MGDRAEADRWIGRDRRGAAERGRAARRVAGAIASIAVVAALAACTSGAGGSASSGRSTVASSGSAGSSSGAGSSAASPSLAGGSGGRVDFQVGSGKAPAAGAVADQTRSVTRTGDLRLSAADPIRVSARIQSIVAAGLGHVDTADEHPGDDPSATLTVRIPSDRFVATLGDIRRTGTTRSVAVRESDVTDRVRDTATRVASLRTSIARLQALIGKAGTAQALVEIEGALTSRETELEQLLGQQKVLADQVAYGTLSIRVEAPSIARNPAPRTFASGFVAGFDGLAATVAATVVGVGVVLPWLVVLGAIGALALLGRRAVRSRAARRASAAA